MLFIQNKTLWNWLGWLPLQTWAREINMCAFVSLSSSCVYVCPRIVGIQNNKSSTNKHIEWLPTLQRGGGPATGQSQPRSKQAGAEQQRLLTAKLIQSEFCVKRKTWDAILPLRQDDNNMKNSRIWSRGPSLSHWLPFSWLMSAWHSQQCSIAQAAVVFQFQM